jgi:hypothetical protein
MFAEASGIIAVVLTTTWAIYVLTTKPKDQAMTVKLDRQYFQD